MTRRWLLLLATLPVGAVPSRAQKPADPAADKENIEAALRLTLAAAAEYEFRAGADEKPLELLREPVLKWSNPTQGDVRGNVFVWTREGRPLVVGSLFKWFTPHTHMAHEFHSLAEGPLSAKFHGEAVWATKEAGLAFANVPGAPAPAATEAQRLLQMKQLAKEFSGFKMTPPAGTEVEVRLLPQPVYRYAAPKQGVVQGGLFAFVQGTDPEILLLVEARGKDVASATWQYAAARMVSTEALRLRHKDKPVWGVEVLPWKEVFLEHEHAYTTFRFKDVPDFLKDAIKPKK
jgi:hypothetical protein